MNTGNLKVKLNELLNFILATILIILWGSVFLIHGIAGAVSWALAKLFFAPMGVLFALISLVVIRKEDYMKSICFFTLTVLTVSIITFYHTLNWYNRKK